MADKSAKLTKDEILAIDEDMRKKSRASIKNFFIGMAKGVTTDLPGFLMDVADKLIDPKNVSFGEFDRSAELFEKMTGIKTKSGSGGADELVGSLVNPIGAAKAIILPAFAAGKTVKEINDARKAFTAGDSLDTIWNKFKLFPDPVTGDMLAVVPDTKAAFKPGVIEKRQGYVSWNMWDNPSMTADLAQSLFSKRPLPEILDHPELFKTLPDIEDTQVGKVVLGSHLGSFDDTSNTIRLNLNRPDRMLSTLLHETQHAIQNNFSLPPGGNTDMFIANPDKVRAATRQATELEEILGAEFNRLYAGQPGLGDKDPARRLGKLLDQASDPKFPFTQAAAQTDLALIPPKILGDYAQIKTVRDAQKAFSALDSSAYDAYRRISGEAQARLVQTQHELGDYTTNPLQLMATELGLKSADDLFQPGALIDASKPVTQLDQTPRMKVLMDFIQNLATSKSVK